MKHDNTHVGSYNVFVVRLPFINLEHIYLRVHIFIYFAICNAYEKKSQVYRIQNYTYLRMHCIKPLMPGGNKKVAHT